MGISGNNRGGRKNFLTQYRLAQRHAVQIRRSTDKKFSKSKSNLLLQLVQCGLVIDLSTVNAGAGGVFIIYVI